MDNKKDGILRRPVDNTVDKQQIGIFLWCQMVLQNTLKLT